MAEIKHLYRKINDKEEICFNVGVKTFLTKDELELLKLILAQNLNPNTIKLESYFPLDARIQEVGPRLSFATPFSAHLVQIAHNLGLTKVNQIEKSRRIISSESVFYDWMTESFYEKPLVSFESDIKPELVYTLPLLEEGPEILLSIKGIKLDEWDRNHLYEYFKDKNRNPTIVEIMDYGNSLCEHSRHGYFQAKQIINGIEIPETLMRMIQSTYQVNPNNSVIAFHDNASAIYGFKTQKLLPLNPGSPSPYQGAKITTHITFTAETHNFPSGVAPFPGAETGTGGRLRDGMATGRGSYIISGTAGYCVGALAIPGYDLPWEKEAKKAEHPLNLALPRDVEIQASNGASDYGNKFGEPLIQGFTRSFDLRISGERWAWLKPIMFTGGIGQIDSQLLKKRDPFSGMKIVQVGGPAYRVGFGGGAASSMVQGENEAELDFDAVQRGDAEEERKLYCALRACNQMRENSPIASIHDQGAGGPLNVLKEIVEGAGGCIDVRKINVADKSMSVLDILVAEYQERNAFLIYPDRLDEFIKICQREKVSCEVLGEVVADKDNRFVVWDSHDSSKVVDWDLNKILNQTPQRTYYDKSTEKQLFPLELPDDLTCQTAMEMVSRQIDVGSKLFLTNKVDRSVSGLIARQQCCGPLQLPLSDVAVVAQSHFGLTGAAKSIGEQARKMLVDPRAGARMAFGEALTNICWGGITDFTDIKCTFNWMWAPKMPGEGVALYEAVFGSRDIMIKTGIAAIGGKDSLSMVTQTKEEVVKSPRQLVVSAFSTVEDITKAITPDIKCPGMSVLVFVNLAPGKNRLGGSALAHCYNQVGNESPDIVDSQLVVNAVSAINVLVKRGLILSGHDRSDGGLAFCLAEMAFAGNCGIKVNLEDDCLAYEKLFSEELGLVFECLPERLFDIKDVFDRYNVTFIDVIGKATNYKNIEINYNDKKIIDFYMPEIRNKWNETSYQIECLQTNPECALSEKNSLYDGKSPQYKLSFNPSLPVYLEKKLPVVILREEGSNGEEEMSSAFNMAGFEPWEVNMDDLIKGRISLDEFRMFAAVGGFSYADHPESAKGWAMPILKNKKLSEMFQRFYRRHDTLSFGVCNGAQLFAKIGYVPWPGISVEKQPYFAENISGRFESRWSTVRIDYSLAVMFNGMEGSILPIWVAHAEGRFCCLDSDLLKLLLNNLIPLSYVKENGSSTEIYPANPNGSQFGITAICSLNGRHLAMMPHPERCFQFWQWPYIPQSWKHLDFSPWLQMFVNARLWLENNP